MTPFDVPGKQAFWKHSGKRRAISPFPTVFSTCHFRQILNCCLQTPSVWKSLKFVVWERVNSLPHDSDFTALLEKRLKTLWEKEKMLVNSIFSFSYNVLYPSKYEFNFFCHIILFSVKAFNPLPDNFWDLWHWGRSLLKTLWEKEKNANKQHFLLFSKCFLSYQ